MGTRSLTHIKDEHEDKTIVTIYRQYDGYPEGIGLELYRFIKGGLLGNGISGKVELGEFFNGMGDFAAQLVAHLKDCVGNVYLYPPDSRNCGEDYTYIIQAKGNTIHLDCYGDDSDFPLAIDWAQLDKDNQ